VVVDTSALIACLEDGGDPFEALTEACEGRVELLVPTTVLKELERLSAERGRRGRIARLALELLNRGAEGIEVKVVHVAAEDTDKALLRTASEYDALLLTADTKLGKVAEARGLAVLRYIKSKKRFG